MKTSRTALLRLSGIGSIAIIFLGAAFAGPGPQNWQELQRLRRATVAKQSAADPVQQPTVAPGMGCPSCKTKVHEESVQSNVVDRTKPRVVKVGVRHYCDSCKGTITKISGSVSDQMQRVHATCATISCCAAA